jgi:Holliday junction resolvase-like predicted endonuclease
VDDKTWLGAVAEARVCAELVAQRWDVFTSLTGKAPFDLVAYKEGEIVRVEVKGCRTMKQSGGYEVQLRSVRPNRTTNRIRHVSAAACDVIAVYLEPINTVWFLPSGAFDGRSTVTLRTMPGTVRNRRYVLASDYATL